ncbi:MAG: hypothetical protein KJ600_03745 [Nanoarchaeota archaeon]|nr:hypothetical protein [Nanoarchaeota archaeon]
MEKVRKVYTMFCYVIAMVSAKESHENVICDLIEDSLELSEETKKNIAQSEKEIKAGKIVSLSEVKKRIDEKV